MAIAEAARRRCEQALAAAEERARAEWREGAAALSAAEAEETRLHAAERKAREIVDEIGREIAERRAAAAVAAAAAAAAEAAAAAAAAAAASAAERAAAVASLQLQHATDAVAAVLAEVNPHAGRLQDAQAQQSAHMEAARRLQAEAEASATSQRLHAELTDHFGKKGVQNLLYTVALSQLEAAAAVYATELSSGRLQLQLSFDDQLRSVRKRVRVRRADGSFAERSVAQLSGGEWRRVGLATNPSPSPSPSSSPTPSPTPTPKPEPEPNPDPDPNQAHRPRPLSRLRRLCACAPRPLMQCARARRSHAAHGRRRAGSKWVVLSLSHSSK